MFSFAQIAARLKETATTLSETLEQTVKQTQAAFQEQERENEVRKSQQEQPQAVITSLWTVQDEKKSILEGELRNRVLQLSNDRAFLAANVTRASFPVDVDAASGFAVKAFADDPALQKLHYTSVPSKMNNEKFWRLFFARVAELRKEIGVEPLPLPMLPDDAAAAVEEVDPVAVGPGKLRAQARQAAKPTASSSATGAAKSNAAPDSPTDDFVKVDGAMVKAAVRSSPPAQSSGAKSSSSQSAAAPKAATAATTNAGTSTTKAAQPAMGDIDMESIESMLADVETSTGPVELSADLEKELNDSLEELDLANLS